MSKSTEKSDLQFGYLVGKFLENICRTLEILQIFLYITVIYV